MNAPRNNSGRPSPGRVATAPPPKAASTSEQSYLKEQASNARTAFRQTLGEIASGLGKGVSPKEWTQAHPWLMLAGSAVAGFTAACAAVPSKEQQELRRLARIEKALNQVADTSDKSHSEHHNGNGKPKKTISGILVAELMQLGMTAISALIRSGMSGPQPMPTDVPPDRAEPEEPATS